jgi:hypothetical protein
MGINNLILNFNILIDLKNIELTLIQGINIKKMQKNI